MRKYLLFGVVLCLAISCNNAQPETAETKEEAPMSKEAEEAPKASNLLAVKGGHMDPICEMEADPSWTDYAVYGTDTIRFCSENCKTAFLARPEKYMKEGAE